MTKSYGTVRALDSLDLDVAEGESVVLLGPSGCGKTTTLRLVAGFERPDQGSIRINERTIVDDRHFEPPEKRHIAVVFQSYALWPHMTVLKNVAFALKHGQQGARLSRAQAKTQVHQALEQVQLDSLGDRYPHQLSGGQQQRVALARALVYQPRALLLDEPLSNLDAALRDDLRTVIKHLHRDRGVTMLYVTHDQTEALSLADRIVVMRGGRVEQIGTPLELHQRPVNAYAARALGPVNMLPAEIVGLGDALNAVRIDGADHPVKLRGAGSRIGDRIVVVARPTHLRLECRRDDGGLGGEVVELMFLGEHFQCVVRLDNGTLVRCLIETGSATWYVGDRVTVVIDENKAVTVDAADLGEDAVDQTISPETTAVGQAPQAGVETRGADAGAAADATEASTG